MTVHRYFGHGLDSISWTDQPEFFGRWEIARRLHDIRKIAVDEDNNITYAIGAERKNGRLAAYRVTASGVERINYRRG